VKKAIQAYKEKQAKEQREKEEEEKQR